MKLRLISQDPLACPREIVLDQFPAEIGRGVDVALRIDDRWISRRHCRLELVAGEIVVHDLGSRHGTYVNGRAIESSLLQPGNELCLGLSHFIVQLIPDSFSGVVHESGELDVAVGAPRRSFALA
ncbi:FHA domain-containing protein [Anatilimnocola floriformis]|uniref:FHA domain-containing protein n=1 Tax=Anatilimnocola floriformis TaxID=2948575 RepID=UPI0020C4A2A1|nr:FHA domain-containing protein [Anatilimnocola floriformis]